jgi:hypothetical protein
MTGYVEECRREWKRLGVPDVLAEEMAAELESDLAEAEADGVSAAELLGESDPRRFATTWAVERGLIAEPSPERSHRRRLLWAAAFVLALVFVAVLGLFAAVGVSVHTHVGSPPGETVAEVVLPGFSGLNACRAVRKATRLGFTVHIGGHEHGYSCRAMVRAENGTARNGQRSVTLWLRRPSG